MPSVDRARFERSSPQINRRPASGSVMPTSILSSVDFPAPLAPTSELATLARAQYRQAHVVNCHDFAVSLCGPLIATNVSLTRPP